MAANRPSADKLAPTKIETITAKVVGRSDSQCAAASSIQVPRTLEKTPAAISRHFSLNHLICKLPSCQIFVSTRAWRAASWHVCNDSRSWQRTETSSRRQRSQACCFGKIALMENRSPPHHPLGNSKPISRWRYGAEVECSRTLTD